MNVQLERTPCAHLVSVSTAREAQKEEISAGRGRTRQVRLCQPDWPFHEKKKKNNQKENSLLIDEHGGTPNPNQSVQQHQLEQRLEICTPHPTDMKQAEQSCGFGSN